MPRQTILTPFVSTVEHRTRMKQPALSIIIPILNEEEILLDVARCVSAQLDAVVGPGRWELIPVDNGSSDRTPQMCEEIRERWPTTRPIRLEEKNIGKAMRAGLQTAQGEFVYLFPVDEHDPLFFAWAWKNREDYDLVLGSKRADPTINGQAPYRRLLSWALNSLLHFLTENPTADTHGIKLMRLEMIRPIVDRCVINRGQFDTELTIRSIRSGLRVCEVPVEYEEKRPPRNLMLTKIGRNVVDLGRLTRALRDEPFQGPLRYHRRPREDLLSSK
jgi:glycosyltransferase involved in cell wall biosynthesis